MAEYVITAPDGRKFKVTGPGTKADALKQVQQQYQAEQVSAVEPEQLPERPVTALEGLRDYGDKLLSMIKGGTDVAGVIATNAVTSPIPGLVGMADNQRMTEQMRTDPVAAIKSRNMFNPTTPNERAQTVQQVQDAVTLAPSTAQGQEYMGYLGEKLQPVGDAFEQSKHDMGEVYRDDTGSDRIAAGMSALPAAIIEGVPILAGGRVAQRMSNAKRAPLERQVTKSIDEARPSQQELRVDSKSLFKEVHNRGVTVKQAPFESLIAKIEADMMDAGADPSSPKSWGVLQRLKKDAESGNLTLPEIERLHKVANGAAKSPDKHEAMLGMVAKDRIDNFLEELTPDDLLTGKASANEVGVLYKQAREQWGRYRRSEIITDAVDKASAAASGWENGLRNEMRALYKKIVSKKVRGFKGPEIAAIKTIADGSPGSNIAKVLGQSGLAGGKLGNNWLGSFLTGGAVVGATGGNIPAAAGVVLGSTGFRVLAQKLTRNNAKFADEVIRAGTDARKITEVYIRNTPKAERTAEQLSLLLMRKEIDLSPLNRYKMEAQAAKLATEKRVQLIGALATGEASSRIEPQPQLGL